jgi:hypothetical protein
MDDSNVLVDVKKIEELTQKIRAFRKDNKIKHGGNYWGNTTLIYLSIFLSASVTIAGIFDEGRLAAILGVILSILLTIQNAFPINYKAEFYRILMAEADNLLIDIEFDTMTQENFNRIKNRFKVLTKYAAVNLPKGEGLEAVRDMYKDFKSKD